MSFTLNAVAHAYERDGPAVLDGIDLELADGDSVAVLGVSGVGKTTLLSLLGLLWERPPQTGSIVYHDGDRAWAYASLNATERTRLRSQQFGFVPQTCYFLPSFRCDQNLWLPLALRGESASVCRRGLDELLERSGQGDLRDPLQRPPAKVSGGQRQRMAVLRAIIHQPRVVFADEPVSNLDVFNKAKMVQLLRDWHCGKLQPDDTRPRTLFLVSHEPETAWELATRFVFLLPRSDRPGAIGCSVHSRDEFPEGARSIRQKLDELYPQPKS